MNIFTLAMKGMRLGEKKKMILEPNVAGYSMPATIIRGAKEGKNLLMTAGIHSGEYPGIAASLQLVDEIDPEKFSGMLLIIHCVNSSGFWSKHRRLLPEDGTDLNNDYPGNPIGTVGERICDYFVTDLFPYADFLVDLHSGGYNEPLTPCLFYPVMAGKQIEEKSFRAAKATNIPYLIASRAMTGHVSYAAQTGLPGLLLERGYGGFCFEEWVKDYVMDLRLLLHHFGAYESEEKRRGEQKNYKKSLEVRAKKRGLWYPSVKENETLKKGQVLGEIRDFDGRTLETYKAREGGKVFYYTAGLSVDVGDVLLYYGLSAHMEPIE